MSDFEMPSFDLDDPDLYFDATKYHPRVVESNSGEVEMEEDVNNGETRSPDAAAAEEEERSSSASVKMSEPGPMPVRYPNLQVTQSMLHPRKIRRTKSADIDCFQ